MDNMIQENAELFNDDDDFDLSEGTFELFR